MLNWDEYNKDEAAVVQQEAMTAKPVVQEAVAEVPEVACRRSQTRHSENDPSS